jgi:flagellar biosynthesis/type III secretory pathway protein FliH
VVRVALEGIQSGTRLLLRTSPGSAGAWAEFCASQLAGDCSVEVVPDGSLKNHECVLETESGRTEVSLDAQLGAIESGFFDLLQAQAGAEDER